MIGILTLAVCAVVCALVGRIAYRRGQLNAFTQSYTALLKGAIGFGDSIYEFCVKRQDINVLSFGNALGKLDNLMKVVASWHNFYQPTGITEKLSVLEEECTSRLSHADSLLGTIGDEFNYTVHKNGDNAAIKKVIDQCLRTLDAFLRNSKEHQTIVLSLDDKK
jgi:hypothetical protein